MRSVAKPDSTSRVRRDVSVFSCWRFPNASTGPGFTTAAVRHTQVPNADAAAPALGSTPPRLCHRPNKQGRRAAGRPGAAISQPSCCLTASLSRAQNPTRSPLSLRVRWMCGAVFGCKDTLTLQSNGPHPKALGMGATGCNSRHTAVGLFTDADPPVRVLQLVCWQAERPVRGATLTHRNNPWIEMAGAGAAVSWK